MAEYQFSRSLIAGGLLLLAGAATAQESICGSLENAYGPFDYRKQRGRALAIVDKVHFNSDVERLIKGQSGRLGGDLDYVLRASPNHHRALASVANWGVMHQGLQPPTLPRSVDCYFDRAMRFMRDDPLPRMLYSSYLQRLGRTADALANLQPLLVRSDLEGLTHFNLGLLLIDLKKPDQALEQAHLAIAKGWTSPILREQLEKGGHWRDPAPAEAAELGASAPASAASD